MWPTVLAVAGTLLGGALTGFLQIRGARIAQESARRDRREESLRQALGELVAALGDHRRAMWRRETLRLDEAGEAAYEAARTASHATRSAVTAPLVAVAVLQPDLAEPARRAALTVFAVRDAQDRAELSGLRDVAIAATDELVAAAGRAMG